MIEYTDRVTVPDKCKNCPTLKQLAATHDALSENVEELTNAGISGDLNELLVQSIMDIDGATREQAEQAVESQKAIISDETMKALEEFDEARDTQVTIGNLSIALCAGELKLKGKTAAQRVAAYICMSRLQAQSTDHPDLEITTVERELRFDDDA